MLCALILYRSGGTYSQSFCQKSAERKSPKKYFSYFGFDVWPGTRPLAFRLIRHKWINNPDWRVVVMSNYVCMFHFLCQWLKLSFFGRWHAFFWRWLTFFRKCFAVIGLWLDLFSIICSFCLLTCIFLYGGMQRYHLNRNEIYFGILGPIAIQPTRFADRTF